MQEEVEFQSEQDSNLEERKRIFKEAMRRNPKELLDELQDNTTTRQTSSIVSSPAPLARTGKSTQGTVLRGHAKSVETMNILKGITEAFSPEEVVELLHQARDFAIKWKSWEGLLALLKFQADYTIGRPVQRSISTTIKPEDFGKYLLDEEPQDE